MPTCPNCGQTVSSTPGVCAACGTTLPRRATARAYVVRGLSLVALVVAAVLLKSLLERRNIRPPTDFLPASAGIAMALDVRPAESSLLRWPAEDRRILAERALDVAQRAVDGTGLELDLREQASHWFNGRLVVASFAGGEAIPLRPRSMLLIAAVSDTRRARGDLDQAVAGLAREAGWERERADSGGQDIVVWREPGRRSEISYAAADGCLILSADSRLVELALDTAVEPRERLVERPEFRDAFLPLPEDHFLWLYGNTSDMLPIMRSLLPVLSEGWLGFIRSYFSRRSRPAERDLPGVEPEAPGRLAVAITAEADGVRAHANYRREPEKELPLPSSDLASLFAFVPKEAAAFALVRGVPDLGALLFPEGVGPDAARRRGPFAAVLRRLLADGALPESAMLVLLPGRPDGRTRLAGALAGGGATEVALRLADWLPAGEAKTLNDTALFAVDHEGLRQLERAAEDTGQRFDFPTSPQLRLLVWLRPQQVWPAVGGVTEARLVIRDNGSGGEGELYVKAAPRHLLGRP